ncbi:MULTISPECIES: hypothetical protein [Enterococcus]|nr:MULTISPECIES: hypothetical protein [Enterococcus]MBE8867115.1 hypothetical protein [Enterococcus hirae]
MKKKLKGMENLFISIIEDRLLKIILMVYFIFIFSILFGNFKKLNIFSDFIVNNIGKYLALQDGSLVTVATVFIGIYFTIYTMLTTIQSDSILASLKEKHFKKILKILTIGFVSSFSYTLYSVFFEVSYNNNSVITTYFILFLAICFFISAFQFGVLLTLILKKDIYGAIKTIQERKKAEEEQKERYAKLDSFLDREQEKVDRIRAEEVSKKIKK